MRKLSRKNAHRKSLIRNLATSLLLYESIETTLAKAKETKTFVDTILSRVNNNGLNEARYLSSVLFDDNAVKKTLVELLPRYQDRKSGFVRIYKNGYKVGDGAAKAIVELVDKKTYIDNTEAKKEDKGDIKKVAAKKIENEVKK
ncbi:MAG: 50S ribosomal protein L17 [bacterium ADurb.Bin212]|nr:MAG: 50S ribosomal protein L17 [bacterium ADurb.Bin212]